MALGVRVEPELERPLDQLLMHLTTVSRSYRDLAEQLRPVPAPRPRKLCRWGLSSCLRFLRLTTDALHQSLLIGVPCVLEVPPCFTAPMAGRFWAFEGGRLPQWGVGGGTGRSDHHLQPGPGVAGAGSRRASKRG